MTERDATVVGIGDHGDGYVVVDGRQLFVPLTAPGDRVRVRFDTAAKADAAQQGELLEISEMAAARQPAPCPHFGPCGGCVVQHLDPESYGAWKRGRLEGALRAQHVEAGVIGPIWHTPPGSRRRATFAARAGGGRVFLGFNEARSHRIVDLEACEVLDPAITALLPPLRSLLAEVMKSGSAVDIGVTRLDDGLDVLVTGHLPLPPAHLERVADFAHRHDLARVARREAVHAEIDPIAYRRDGRVLYDGIPVRIAPGAFLQATVEGEARLRDLIAQALPAGSRIADLFCGAGTFALPLARHHAVAAFDTHAGAIAALDEAARLSGLHAQVSARARDLFRDPVSVPELAAFDAIVLDPPRQGAKAQAAALAQSAVPLVVMASCNPASFARDAAILQNAGFRLDRVDLVDQFLWSAHLEVIGVFRRP